MTCADLEMLLCDYVDGTLDRERMQTVELHLAACAACAELAKDAAGAVAFMDRAAGVDVPQELITRILFEIPAKRPRERKGLSKTLGQWLQPILQPRFAMGMAMTILSFSMLGKFAGIEPRQLKASDLNPVAFWMALDDRVHRAWERGVKYYDSLKLVYESQTRLKEWSEPEEGELQPPPAVPVQKQAPDAAQR